MRYCIMFWEDGSPFFPLRHFLLPAAQRRPDYLEGSWLQAHVWTSSTRGRKHWMRLQTDPPPADCRWLPLGRQSRHLQWEDLLACDPCCPIFIKSRWLALWTAPLGPRNGRCRPCWVTSYVLDVVLQCAGHFADCDVGSRQPLTIPIL